MTDPVDTVSVLLAEDEESFIEALQVGLAREGFDVTVARDGIEALRIFDSTRIDLVLLDLMLPKLSGIDVCRAIRGRSSVPIIMVTAKSTEIDTVVGLEVGADDYVTKPYRLRELVARMRAVLRRAPRAVTMPLSTTGAAVGVQATSGAAGTAQAPGETGRGSAARHSAAGRSHTPAARTGMYSIAPGDTSAGGPHRPAVAAIEVGDVTVDPDRHRVFVRGEEVRLRRKEFELLELLATNAGRVLTRDILIDRVWGADYVGDTKTLDVHIKRLRAHLEEDPSNPRIITTVRGVGYRLEVPRR